MVHMVNYAGAIVASTNNQAVAAPSDASLTRTATGNQYLCPFDCTILGAYGFNDFITRARCNYPSYRDIGLPDVQPVMKLAQPTAPFQISWWGKYGPRVRQTEELGMDMSTGASVTLTAFTGMWLSTSFAPVPEGRRFTVHGTSAQTLVANQYTLGSISLDQTLPYGNYGCIGLAAYVAGAVAGRLVFPNNASIRPGVVMGSSIANFDYLQHLRQGHYGLLGTFAQTNPPQLEILGGTAGAVTADVWLDLVTMS